MFCSRASQDTELVYRVTADGVAGVLFNGVCDWLYRGQSGHRSGSFSHRDYLFLKASCPAVTLLPPALLVQQLRVFKRKLFA